LERTAQDRASKAMDEYTLRDQRARVEAADRLQAEEPVVVDMGDEEPDLVHVGGDHDARAIAALGADDAAQSIDPQVVDEGAQLVGDERPHLVLPARNTWCRAETPQEIEVHGVRHVASMESAIGTEGGL
jgi:hypothetical protein